MRACLGEGSGEGFGKLSGRVRSSPWEVGMGKWKGSLAEGCARAKAWRLERERIVWGGLGSSGALWGLLKKCCELQGAWGRWEATQGL